MLLLLLLLLQQQRGADPLLLTAASASLVRLLPFAFALRAPALLYKPIYS